MKNTKLWPLKVLIFEKFGAESKMADELGWRKQRLNRITNGLKVPNIQEISDISCCLGKSLIEIAEFFLPVKSPNGDDRQNKNAS